MDDECKQVLKEKLILLEKKIKKIEGRIVSSNIKESTHESEENFYKESLSNEYYQKFQLRKNKEKIKKSFKDELAMFLITTPIAMAIASLGSYLVTQEIGAFAAVVAGALTATAHIVHYDNKVKNEKEFVKGFNKELNETMIDFYEEQEISAKKDKNMQISNSNQLHEKLVGLKKEVAEINNILKPNNIQEEKEIIKQKSK